MEFTIIYLTCANEKEATLIAEKLINTRLVACANIMPQTKSMYLWSGKLEVSSEVPMILKTSKQHTKKVKEIILQNHSYDTPAVIEISANSLHETYSEWLSNSMGILT